ncbi:hypothetical protein PJIAN_3129 [Paludibacter jiangxiensis]|uniref:YD repeat-containing protein n=2 Tax=Paludibacter jiangxiensis TaxID=681398 RepID=A0A161LUS2_9BACT|nr:hypothetical protein PJIAN_3129 [Paludibacter jiangxiensis]
MKFLLLGVILISCSKMEENPDNPTDDAPELIQINVTVLYSNISLYNQSDFKITYEYDTNKRLIKQTGSFIQAPSSTGYRSFFTDNIYTTLTYRNNTVTVEDFSSSTDFTVQKNTRYFTLNSENQINSKEIPSNNNYGLKKQTFIYVNNKLSEIKTSFPNMPYDSSDPNDYVTTYSEKFYFDTSGNLSKTEYVEQRNGVNKGEKIVRTFANYDNSTNIFKRLQLLDNFFYRSLSKNNFREYREVHFYNDVVNYTNTDTCIFDYDSNGQIISNGRFFFR